MKLLFIFLIGIIGYDNSHCAVDADLTKLPVDTPMVINKIKSDFLSINKQLKLFKKKSRDASGMSAEGGEVIGYYDKGRLRKVHCVYYGETGKTESDYYFNHKALFFFYRKNVFYDKPMYLKDFKIKNTVEERHYFDEGKAIKTLIKPNSRALSYIEIEKGLKQAMDILDGK